VRKCIRADLIMILRMISFELIRNEASIQVRVMKKS